MREYDDASRLIRIGSQAPQGPARVTFALTELSHTAAGSSDFWERDPDPLQLWRMDIYGVSP